MACGFKPGVWPVPADEEERMRVLHSISILDSGVEKAFEHIADWYAALCPACAVFLHPTRVRHSFVHRGRRCFTVPICIVTLVDSNRQWFKAAYGLDAAQTGRDVAFCSHAIMPDAPEIFEVPDTLADARFATNPLVTGPPHIRYYAGAPLYMGSQKLGTVCIIDAAPRPPLSTAERGSLINLAAMASDLLVSRLSAKKLENVNLQLASIIDTAHAPIFAVDENLCVTVWNRKIAKITSILNAKGRTILELLVAPGSAQSSALAAVMAEAIEGTGCPCFDFDLSGLLGCAGVHLQMSVEPKRDEMGRIVGAVCVGEWWPNGGVKLERGQ